MGGASRAGVQRPAGARAAMPPGRGPVPVPGRGAVGRWPAERGLWLVLGVPWAAGAWLSHAPWPAVWLGGAMAAAVMAREHLLSSARSVRRHGSAPGWPRGLLWAAGASLCLGLWAWWLRPGPLPLAGVAAIVLAGLFEAALRLRNARAWWPRVPAAAVVAWGAALAAAGARGPAAHSVAAVAAAMGYAAAASVCAVELYLERIPRGGPPGRPADAGAWLWGWTAGGGGLLFSACAATGAAPVGAVALALGVLHAEMAWQQPRTLAVRRLGWREAAWLLTVAAALMWAAGRGAV